MERMKPERVAVVLLNLGGPDNQASVRPFLYNFFTDKNIIGLPFPFRHLLAGLIAFRRSKKEAGSAYSLLNWRSPLLENTRAQATALETVLQAASVEAEYKCFTCMRYWHPMADEVMQDVKTWGADRIILLPLYPQYSTTTTRSSFQSWRIAAQKAKLSIPVSAVCCYPEDSGYVSASTAHIRIVWDKIQTEIQSRNLKPPRLLFSAHGLPEKIIASGDPYQWQCEKSAKAIVDRLAISGLDWQICYQSRVGPLKWIGPSTIEALEQAARDQVPVMIYPHAFVSEHVETLVEIEIEYRHLAEKLGVLLFARVETVSDDQVFIEGLKDIVLNQSPHGLHSYTKERICPSTCGRCAMADPTLKPIFTLS